MNKKDEPAFPSQEDWMDDDERYRTFHKGMSLRDWFATHAPEPPLSFVSVHSDPVKAMEDTAAKTSAWNYIYARAMLKERAKE